MDMEMWLRKKIQLIYSLTSDEPLWVPDRTIRTILDGPQSFRKGSPWQQMVQPRHFSSIGGSMVVSPTVQGTYQNAVVGQPNTPGVTISSGTPINFTNGAGAFQCDQLYFVQLTMPVSPYAQNLTFAGAILQDMYGQNITFSRLKVLLIQHMTTTTAVSVTIGNATHPLGIINGTGTMTLNNGAQLLIVDPGTTAYPTTIGSTDTLKIVNNDSQIATVNVLAMGAVP